MKVLIAYDGSAHADAALDDLCRAGLPRDVEAIIVSVSECPASASAGEQAARILDEAKEFAASARNRVRSHFPDWKVRAEGIPGTPSQELMRMADEWEPNLIVVGSQGRSALGRLFLGSVSQKIATEARSSVRVVRRIAEKGKEAPLRILIGVDGSIGAERAVRAVAERVWSGATEARIVGVDDSVAPTRIAHILPKQTAIIRRDNQEAAAKRRQMAKWAEDELRALGLRVAVAIEKGDPELVLIEEARKWDADCVFVGPHGADKPNETSGLGSVATALVTNAPCTVEIVRYNANTSHGRD